MRLHTLLRSIHFQSELVEIWFTASIRLFFIDRFFQRVIVNGTPMQIQFIVYIRGMDEIFNA